MGYIVWLASYPKSGNTWVRIFLRNLIDPGAAGDINKLKGYFPYDADVANEQYRRLDPAVRATLGHRDLLDIRTEAQCKIAAGRANGALVKTHTALIVEEGVALIDPTVTRGAVYIVRNPLDVAVSFAAHLSASLDATIDLMNLFGALTPGTLEAVPEHLGSWSENVASWTHAPRPDIHVVRYEDLLETPIKSFGGIARFLGLEVPRAKLEKAIKASSFRVLQRQEAEKGFVERPPMAAAPFFRQGQAGQGRKTLTPEQIERLVAANRPGMERFGYLPPR